MAFAMILADFKGALMDLRPQDLAPAMFWGVWLVVLFSGFKGIDLRDDITQLSYAAIILALGVTLGIALPAPRSGESLSVFNIVLILSFILAARVRWVMAISSGQGKLPKGKSGKA